MSRRTGHWASRLDLLGVRTPLVTYSINETARIGAQTPDAGLTKTEREVFDMADKILPTPEQLRELLRYEPETGKLYWKARPAELFKDKRSHGAWNARYAGKEAF